MKVTVQSLCDAQPVEKDWTWAGVLADLFKARLTLLVLLTTGVGFYVGFQGAIDYGLLWHTLFGTALVASGASALNQYWEHELDAKMERTQNRPIPAGKLHPDTVLIIGGLCATLGSLYLAWTVNLLTSALGAVTLLSYMFVYTPLKQVTTLNTVIGAIPGALPPVMGWAAARGELSFEGWSLFAILFFWQVPHFLAIAWIYREDYARAGFCMLPVVEPDGASTGRQAVRNTLGLLPISLFPALLGMAGWVYFVGALALGVIFLWSAAQFSQRLTPRHARRLFFVSILYLPLLLGLMVLDKVAA